MVPLIRNTQNRRPMAPHSPRRVTSAFRQGATLSPNSKADADVSADDLVALGFLFCKSRVLLTALDMDLFTKIAQNGGRQSLAQLQALLGLHDRAKDFFDALVSLQLLTRDDSDPETSTSVYLNTESAQMFLVQGSDAYIGDLLENCSSLYESYINLQDANCKMISVGSLMERIMSAAKVRTARSIYEGSVHTTQDDMSSVSGLGDDTVVSTDSNDLTFDFIVQLAFGFAPSRMLHMAVELGVFALLATASSGRLTPKEMKKLVGVDEARIKECLRTLVGFKVLGMKVERGELHFFNTPVSTKYLDPSLPTYIGGVFRMSAAYEFQNWNNLITSLKTGKPVSDPGPELSKRPCYMTYLGSRSCIYAPAFANFAKDFDFSSYKSLVDFGGATGRLACAVALENKRMRCITANESFAMPLAEQHIRACGLEGRVVSMKHDNLLDDALPRAEVLSMSFILHDLNVDERKAVLTRAIEALSKGGALVVIDETIDDERRVNANALCTSLNLLLEKGARGPTCFTPAELRQLCREVGFAKFEVQSLGSCTAMIAYK